jgi:hypothetical protein
MTSDEREDVKFHLERDPRRDAWSSKKPKAVTTISSSTGNSRRSSPPSFLLRPFFFSYVRMHVASVDKKHELDLLTRKSDSGIPPHDREVCRRQFQVDLGGQRGRAVTHLQCHLRLDCGDAEHLVLKPTAAPRHYC